MWNQPTSASDTTPVLSLRTSDPGPPESFQNEMVLTLTISGTSTSFAGSDATMSNGRLNWFEPGIRLAIFADVGVKLAVVTTPVAPTSLSAAPGLGEATLSWTDPDDDTIDKWQYRVSADGGTNWDPDWTDISGKRRGHHLAHRHRPGQQYRIHLRAARGERGRRWPGLKRDRHHPPRPVLRVRTGQSGLHGRHGDHRLILPAATGGTAPLTYTLVGPNGTDLTQVPGLSFDASTRTLSGTPTMGAAARVTYTATDANGAVASLNFTVNVSGWAWEAE